MVLMEERQRTEHSGHSAIPPAIAACHGPHAPGPTAPARRSGTRRQL